MTTVLLDPLTDPRYDGFVAVHPAATVFHTSAWIRVLHEAYGFRAGCVALIEENRIRGLLPFMETRSITGKRRCVSLPFSDFCEPLFEDRSEFDKAFIELQTRAKKTGWRCIELRGANRFFSVEQPYAANFSHDIDLTKAEDDLFRSLNDATRRNIRKAQRESLIVTHEASLEALKNFYRLNCLTRREHGLPPQPWPFFTTILKRVLLPGNGFITSVSRNGKTIAASIFLFCNKRAYYKYGASEKKYQHFRPNDIMLWKSLLYCKQKDYRTLNLGRTEQHHTGLLRFKRGWGGEESPIRYYRYVPASDNFITYKRGFTESLYPTLFSRLPVFIMKLIGNVSYRFAG